MPRAKLPNLRHVRLALAILEGQSLRSAARSLSLTEPAASLALGALERFYGVPFFERTSRGLLATGYGEVFQRRAVRSLFLISRAVVETAPGPLDQSMTARLLAGITTAQLQAAAAMRQQRSFRLAAEIAGVLPTSIQRNLDTLERVLGWPLLRRSATGAHFNASGEVFGRFIGRGLEELHAIRSEMAELDGEIGGLVSVGVVRVSAAEIIPDTIVRLAREAPRGRVHVMRDNYELMIEALQSGRIDYVCSTMRSGVPPDLRCEVLADTDLKVFCGPHHPLATRNDVNLRDLLDWRWVGPPSRTGAAVAFRGMFTSAGLEPPELAVETICSEIIRRIVMTSDFLAISNTTNLTHKDTTLEGMTEIAGVSPRLVRPICLLSRKDWQPTRLHGLFEQMLRRTCEELPGLRRAS